MPSEKITVAEDSDEIRQLIDNFKLKAEPNIYRNEFAKATQDLLDAELRKTQSGYIEAALEVVKNGQLTEQFATLATEELKTYIGAKLGDLTIYGRHWQSLPNEYEVSVSYNAGTSEQQCWIDLRVSLDANFTVRRATGTYNPDEADKTYLSSWVTKHSG